MKEIWFLEMFLKLIKHTTLLSVLKRRFAHLFLNSWKFPRAATPSAATPRAATILQSDQTLPPYPRIETEEIEYLSEYLSATFGEYNICFPEVYNKLGYDAGFPGLAGSHCIIAERNSFLRIEPVSTSEYHLWDIILYRNAWKHPLMSSPRSGTCS